MLKQGAALERPTFPINTPLFGVPGPNLAAILDCCTINGILRVLQETLLNDHLLKKDDPLHSSTILRIWHPLQPWDLTYNGSLKSRSMAQDVLRLSAEEVPNTFQLDTTFRRMKGQMCVWFANVTPIAASGGEVPGHSLCAEEMAEYSARAMSTFLQVLPGYALGVMTS